MDALIEIIKEEVNADPKKIEDFYDPVVQAELKKVEYHQLASRALGDIGKTVKSVIPALLKASKHPRVYSYSLEIFQYIGQPAVTPLVEALKHQDKTIRVLAIKGLTEIKDPTEEDIPTLMESHIEQAVPALMESLNDEDSQVRNLAVVLLVKLNVKKKEMLPALLQSLKNQDKEVSTLAIEALGASEEIPEEAIPTLIETLKSKNFDLRRGIVLALNKIGKKAILVFLEEAYPDEFILNGFLNLEELGDPFLSILKEALTHENFKIRQMSAIALVVLKIKTNKAIPALIEALKHPNPEVRKYAVEGLEELGEIAEEALPALIEATARNTLDTSTGTVRYKASVLVKKFGIKAIPMLIKALDHQDPCVRESSVAHLSELGDRAPEAIPSLIKLLGDSEIIGVSSTLKHFGTKAIPKYLNALKSENLEVRREIMRIMIDFGDKVAEEAIPTLINVLRDEDWKINQWASETLEQFGQKALPALTDALKGERIQGDQKMRTQLKQLMNKIKEKTK